MSTKNILFLTHRARLTHLRAHAWDTPLTSRRRRFDEDLNFRGNVHRRRARANDSSMPENHTLCWCRERKNRSTFRRDQPKNRRAAATRFDTDRLPRLAPWLQLVTLTPWWSLNDDRARVLVVVRLNKICMKLPSRIRIQLLPRQEVHTHPHSSLIKTVPHLRQRAVPIQDQQLQTRGNPQLTR